MKNKDCFECGAAAEHQHHVVPRVKKGTATVPLCIECHAKVHNTNSMTKSYLSKLGLMKIQSAFFAKVFNELMINDKSLDDLANDIDIKIYLNKSKHKDLIIYLKRFIKRMQVFTVDDFLDILDQYFRFNDVVSFEIGKQKCNIKYYTRELARLDVCEFLETDFK